MAHVYVNIACNACKACPSAPSRCFLRDTAGRPRCAAEDVSAAFRPLLCAMRAFTGILHCILWHAYAGCVVCVVYLIWRMPMIEPYSYSECVHCKINAACQ